MFNGLPLSCNAFEIFQIGPLIKYELEYMLEVNSIAIRVS